jgi:hypothetical protein
MWACTDPREGAMKPILFSAFVAGVMAAIVVPARGGSISLISNPADLMANDSIDWSQLGPDNTLLASSVSVKSAGGLAATVTTGDPTGLLRADEGGVVWLGNFTIGDHLLTNNQSNYFPLTLAFGSPIFGAGTNIQLDAGGPFTATIEAFAGNKSLGMFTEDGVSNQNEDGSAIFIGVKDTTAEITSIVLGIANPPAVSSDFAINSLEINKSAGSVPEPSSFLTSLSGLLMGLGWYLWRRRKVA